MGKGEFNRRKENYYAMNLYFSSSKKDEVALYYFLKQLSQRRKATDFITGLIAEYLRLCGFKDPSSVKYEDVGKLPSIEELMNKKGNDTISSANFVDMLASLVGKSTEVARKEETKEVDTPKPVPKEEPVIAQPQQTQAPEAEMDYKVEKETEAEPVQDESEGDAIEADWLQGLSAFTGEL